MSSTPAQSKRWRARNPDKIKLYRRTPEYRDRSRRRRAKTGFPYWRVPK